MRGVVYRRWGVADGHKRFYVGRNGKSMVGNGAGKIGDWHVVGKVRGGYEASIREDGNKVQVSKLCARQSPQIFPNR